MQKTIKNESISEQNIIYNNRDFKKYKKHRLKKILKFLSKKNKINLLDVGSGRGHFFEEINKYIPNINYIGVDFSEKQVEIGKKNGLDIRKQDLTKKWNFKDESFDVVFASEIIEHIFDTDFFVSEANRVLKKNGIIIITTPNVASLGDRLRLLFGKLPSALENRASLNHSGHIRAFVKKDLINLLKDNNFKEIYITGRDFYLPLIKHNTFILGKINDFLSNLFPSLSAGFIALAKKK
ncbi:MAG: class I SAM-dependent methyltransferase [Candidatus Woesearchaeota archaeon]